MQAKIISLHDYKDKKIPTQEEIKNNEAKITAALERISNNLRILEKYGIKKNN